MSAYTDYREGLEDAQSDYEFFCSLCHSVVFRAIQDACLTPIIRKRGKILDELTVSAFRFLYGDARYWLGFVDIDHNQFVNKFLALANSTHTHNLTKHQITNLKTNIIMYDEDMI